jgi:hypothetical protein
VETTAYVERGVGAAMWRYQARVLGHAPAEVIAQRLPAAVAVAAIDDHSCMVSVGSDTPQLLAVYLGMLRRQEPPELVDYLRALSERYARATHRPA